jgi:hypothetical protein
MTPKEKAKELVLKFAFKGAQHEGEAKTFALIAVDEIIQAIRFTDAKSDLGYVGYWQEVKQKIENYKL